MLRDTIGKNLHTFVTDLLLRTALGLTAEILSNRRFCHRRGLIVVILWWAVWRWGRCVWRRRVGVTWAGVLVETKGVGDPGYRVASQEHGWRIGIFKLKIRIKWHGDSRG